MGTIKVTVRVGPKVAGTVMVAGEVEVTVAMAIAGPISTGLHAFMAVRVGIRWVRVRVRARGLGLGLEG